MPQKKLSQIAQSIKKLESSQEIESFLQAFLTPKELQNLQQRFNIIEALMQKIPQREIAKNLGISISQISRGSEELQFGKGARIFPKIFKKN